MPCPGSAAVQLRSAVVAAMWLLPGPLPAVAATPGVAVSTAPVPARFRIARDPLRAADRRRQPGRAAGCLLVVRDGRIAVGAVRGAGSGRPAAARPVRLYLPARADRHAHAPDRRLARDRRSQRVLPPHPGRAGRDRPCERARHAAGRIHQRARRGYLHCLGRPRPARRHQPGQHDRAAHAGGGLLPDDPGGWRRPGHPWPPGVVDSCDGAHGRGARPGAVPAEGRTGGRRRCGCAEDHRLGCGAGIRRRPRRARDAAGGDQGRGRRCPRARLESRRPCPRRAVDQGRDPGRRRHHRACLADRRRSHRAREAAWCGAGHGRLQRRLHRYRRP